MCLCARPVRQQQRKEHQRAPLHRLVTLNGDLDRMNDLIDLKGARLDLVVETLKKRYEKNAMNTYASYPQCLVAVNPGYDPQRADSAVVEDYAFVTSPLRPHVFGIASAAHQQMCLDRSDHAIVTNGDSGSGKTEATRRILRFFAQRTAAPGRIESQAAKIIDVLDVFGNASTAANQNASRYGKFVSLLHEKTGSHTTADSGRVATTLLEQRRVVSRSYQERSFHIFYQMCAGADREEARQLGLLKAVDYTYLADNRQIEASLHEDAAWYKSTRTAMADAGLSADEQLEILKVCSCVLAIGNVDFTDAVDSISFTDSKKAEVVANLLGVDRSVLFRRFAYRSVVTGRRTEEYAMSTAEARSKRDGLAELTYTRLFHWLVDRLNASLQPVRDMDAHKYSTICALDLYGFEAVDANGFDQLCVNFADEANRSLCSRIFFEKERTEYLEDGVDFPIRVENLPQTGCLDTLERPREGLVACLDRECDVANSADQSFNAKLGASPPMAAHAKNLRVPRGADFVLRHTAGDVAYRVDGFCSSNRASQHEDFVSMCQASRNPFVRCEGPTI